MAPPNLTFNSASASSQVDLSGVAASAAAEGVGARRIGDEVRDGHVHFVADA